MTDQGRLLAQCLKGRLEKVECCGVVVGWLSEPFDHPALVDAVFRFGAHIFVRICEEGVRVYSSTEVPSYLFCRVVSNTVRVAEIKARRSCCARCASRKVEGVSWKMCPDGRGEIADVGGNCDINKIIRCICLAADPLCNDFPRLEVEELEPPTAEPERVDEEWLDGKLEEIFQSDTPIPISGDQEKVSVVVCKISLGRIRHRPKKLRYVSRRLPGAERRED